MKQERSAGLSIGKQIYCLIALSWMTSMAAAEGLKLVAEPFPPYVLEVAGEPSAQGPFAEVMHAVCERIAIRCSLQILPWRRSMALIDRGDADGIFPMARTHDRERVFYFSEPVVTSASSFFVRTTSNFQYSKPSDLDGYSVAVYGPSAGSSLVEEILKSGSTGKAIIEISNATVLRKLNGGRYGDETRGLAVVNRDVGIYAMKTEGLTGIKYAGDLKKVPLMIAFSRKIVSEEKFQEFNNALKALIRDGTVAAILERHAVKTSN